MLSLVGSTYFPPCWTTVLSGCRRSKIVCLTPKKNWDDDPNRAQVHPLNLIQNPKKLGLEDDVPIDHSQLKGFLVKFRGCNSYIFQQRSRRQVLKPRWALHCQRRRDRPSIGEWVAWRRILFFLVGRTEMTLMGTSQFKPPKMTMYI